MKRDQSPETAAFIEDAKAVSIVEAFSRAGYSLSSLRRMGAEFVGPCPRCGGKDRFSINPAKSVWYCRGADQGGYDGVSLVQYLDGCLYLDACEIVTGIDRPRPMSAEERLDAARRRAQAEERRRQALEEYEAKAKRQDELRQRYRRREWDRCREDWRDGEPFRGSDAEKYLIARGLDAAFVDDAYFRCHQDLAFWGRQTDGRSVILHRGPAMLCLFVRPVDGGFQPIGLHRTWIDLAASPKFRPVIADPINAGETLPSKKMRGSKSGGLLPIAGRFSQCRRMVAGEGIETVIGFAMRDGLQPDTFYCAAGDLGNLCGKAVSDSRFRHPTKFNIGRDGRRRPVNVPGVVPDLDSSAMPVPDHVDELVLLGDGDSDPVVTRAAMKRGAARHALEGRTVSIIMAPAGKDFGEVAA